MKRKLLSVLLSLAMTLSTGILVSAEEDNEEFERFLEEEFIAAMESDYMEMHYDVSDYRAYGIEKPELTIGYADWDSFEETAEAYQESLDELEAFDYDSLSESQKIDYNIYHFFLETQRDQNKYPQVYSFFDPSDGIHDNLITNFTEFVFRNKEDVEDYLTVLASVPKYVQDAIDVTKRQAANGFFLTDTQLDETKGMIEGFIAKKENNELIVSFSDAMELVSFLSYEEKQEYLQKNRELVLNSYIPSYENALSELESLRGSRNFEGGLCNYRDGGREYYQALIRYRTGSDLSISKQLTMMEEFLIDLADEYVDVLVNDRQAETKYDAETINLKTPDDVLKYHQQHLSDFPEGPAVDYRCAYLDPSVNNDSTLAYYMLPALDEYTTNNVIKINGENVSETNDLYESLAHEGFPGHLYQNTWFLNTNPRHIRIVADQLGYMEGWAMYAQLSSWEYAELSDSAKHLHQIYTAISYAEDAAVDLGVNGLGWTEADVADWLDSVGLNKYAAKSLYEFVLDRPGSLIPYGVGLVRLLTIRADAIQRMGSKFNLKEFNTVVLTNGPRPFDLVEQDVEAYITGEKIPMQKPSQSSAGSSQETGSLSSPAKRRANPMTAVIGGLAFAVIGVVSVVMFDRHRKKDPLA